MKRSLALACALAAAAPATSAADPETSIPLAKQFFDKGVQRMNAGKCEASAPGDDGACREARDLFARAYALYPAGLGALRNLARVERSLGLYASAAGHLRDLVRKAPSDPKPSRQMWATFAKRDLEAIEPRLAYVLVRVGDTEVPGVTLSLDGTRLPAEALGVRLEADPGVHAIDAAAPGRLPFHVDVPVHEGETQTVRVDLPPLPRATDDAAPDARATTAPPLAVAAPPASSQGARGAHRTAPLLVLGGGVLTVAAGLGLGYVAIQKRIEACGASTACEPNGLATGKSFATASTVVTAVGAGALVAGGIWYLASGAAPRTTTAARAPALTPSLAPTYVGLDARGAF